GRPEEVLRLPEDVPQHVSEERMLGLAGGEGVGEEALLRELRVEARPGSEAAQYTLHGTDAALRRFGLGRVPEGMAGESRPAFTLVDQGTGARFHYSLGAGSEARLVSRDVPLSLAQRDLLELVNHDVAFLRTDLRIEAVGGHGIEVVDARGRALEGLLAEKLGDGRVVLRRVDAEEEMPARVVLDGQDHRVLEVERVERSVGGPALDPELAALMKNEGLHAPFMPQGEVGPVGLRGKALQEYRREMAAYARDKKSGQSLTDLSPDVPGGRRPEKLIGTVIGEEVVLRDERLSVPGLRGVRMWIGVPEAQAGVDAGRLSEHSHAVLMDEASGVALTDSEVVLRQDGGFTITDSWGDSWSLDAQLRGESRQVRLPGFGMEEEYLRFDLTGRELPVLHDGALAQGTLVVEHVRDEAGVLAEVVVRLREGVITWRYDAHGDLLEAGPLLLTGDAAAWSMQGLSVLFRQGSAVEGGSAKLTVELLGASHASFAVVPLAERIAPGLPRGFALTDPVTGLRWVADGDAHIAHPGEAVDSGVGVADHAEVSQKLPFEGDAPRLGLSGLQGGQEVRFESLPLSLHARQEFEALLRESRMSGLGAESELARSGETVDMSLMKGFDELKHFLDTLAGLEHRLTPEGLTPLHAEQFIADARRAVFSRNLDPNLLQEGLPDVRRAALAALDSERLGHSVVGGLARQVLDAHLAALAGEDSRLPALSGFTVIGREEGGHRIVDDITGLGFTVTDRESGGWRVVEDNTKLGVEYDHEHYLVARDILLEHEHLPEEMSGLQATIHYSEGIPTYHPTGDPQLLERYHIAAPDPELVDRSAVANKPQPSFQIVDAKDPELGHRYHFTGDGTHTHTDLRLEASLGYLRYDAGEVGGAPELFDAFGTPVGEDGMWSRMELLPGDRVALISVYPTPGRPFERTVVSSRTGRVVEERVGVPGERGDLLGAYWKIDHETKTAVRLDVGIEKNSLTGEEKEIEYLLKGELNTARVETEQDGGIILRSTQDNRILFPHSDSVAVATVAQTRLRADQLDALKGLYRVPEAARREAYEALLADAKTAVQLHAAGPAPAEISEHAGFTVTPLPDGGRLVEHQATGLHTEFKQFDGQWRWVSREYWPVDQPQIMDGLKAVITRTWDNTGHEVLSHWFEGRPGAEARFDVTVVPEGTPEAALGHFAAVDVVHGHRFYFNADFAHTVRDTWIHGDFGYIRRDVRDAGASLQLVDAGGQMREGWRAKPQGKDWVELKPASGQDAKYVHLVANVHDGSLRDLRVRNMDWQIAPHPALAPSRYRFSDGWQDLRLEGSIDAPGLRLVNKDGNTVAVPGQFTRDANGLTVRVPVAGMPGHAPAEYRFGNGGVGLLHTSLPLNAEHNLLIAKDRLMVVDASGRVREGWAAEPLDGARIAITPLEPPHGLPMGTILDARNGRRLQEDFPAFGEGGEPIGSWHVDLIRQEAELHNMSGGVVRTAQVGVGEDGATWKLVERGEDGNVLADSSQMEQLWRDLASQQAESVRLETPEAVSAIISDELHAPQTAGEIHPVGTHRIEELGSPVSPAPAHPQLRGKAPQNLDHNRLLDHAAAAVMGWRESEGASRGAHIEGFTIESLSNDRIATIHEATGLRMEFDRQLNWTSREFLLGQAPPEMSAVKVAATREREGAPLSYRLAHVSESGTTARFEIRTLDTTGRRPEQFEIVDGMHRHRYVFGQDAVVTSRQIHLRGGLDRYARIDSTARPGEQLPVLKPNGEPSQDWNAWLTDEGRVKLVRSDAPADSLDRLEFDAHSGEFLKEVESGEAPLTGAGLELGLFRGERADAPGYFPERAGNLVLEEHNAEGAVVAHTVFLRDLPVDLHGERTELEVHIRHDDGNLYLYEPANSGLLDRFRLDAADPELMAGMHEAGMPEPAFQIIDDELDRRYHYTSDGTRTHTDIPIQGVGYLRGDMLNRGVPVQALDAGGRVREDWEVALVQERAAIVPTETLHGQVMVTTVDIRDGRRLEEIFPAFGEDGEHIGSWHIDLVESQAELRNINDEFVRSVTVEQDERSWWLVEADGSIPLDNNEVQAHWMELALDSGFEGSVHEFAPAHESMSAHESVPVETPAESPHPAGGVDDILAQMYASVHEAGPESVLPRDEISDMAHGALTAYSRALNGREPHVEGFGSFEVMETEGGHLVVERDTGLTFGIAERAGEGHLVAEQQTGLGFEYDAAGSLVARDVFLHDLPGEMAPLQVNIRYEGGELSYRLDDRSDSGLLERFEVTPADGGLVESMREAGMSEPAFQIIDHDFGHRHYFASDGTFTHSDIRVQGGLGYLRRDMRDEGAPLQAIDAVGRVREDWGIGLGHGRGRYQAGIAPAQTLHGQLMGATVDIRDGQRLKELFPAFGEGGEHIGSWRIDLVRSQAELRDPSGEFVRSVTVEQDERSWRLVESDGSIPLDSFQVARAWQEPAWAEVRREHLAHLEEEGLVTYKVRDKAGEILGAYRDLYLHALDSGHSPFPVMETGGHLVDYEPHGLTLEITETEDGHLVLDRSTGLTFEITESEEGGHLVVEKETGLGVEHNADGSLVAYDVFLHDLPEEMAGLQVHLRYGEEFTADDGVPFYHLEDRSNSGLLDHFNIALADPALAQSTRAAGRPVPEFQIIDRELRHRYHFTSGGTSTHTDTWVEGGLGYLRHDMRDGRAPLQALDAAGRVREDWEVTLTRGRASIVPTWTPHEQLMGTVVDLQDGRRLMETFPVFAEDGEHLGTWNLDLVLSRAELQDMSGEVVRTADIKVEQNSRAWWLEKEDGSILLDSGQVNEAWHELAMEPAFEPRTESSLHDSASDEIQVTSLDSASGSDRFGSEEETGALGPDTSETFQWSPSQEFDVEQVIADTRGAMRGTRLEPEQPHEELVGPEQPHEESAEPKPSPEQMAAIRREALAHIEADGQINRAIGNSVELVVAAFHDTSGGKLHVDGLGHFTLKKTQSGHLAVHDTNGLTFEIIEKEEGVHLIVEGDTGLGFEYHEGLQIAHDLFLHGIPEEMKGLKVHVRGDDFTPDDQLAYSLVHRTGDAGFIERFHLTSVDPEFAASSREMDRPVPAFWITDTEQGLRHSFDSEGRLTQTNLVSLLGADRLDALKGLYRLPLAERREAYETLWEDAETALLLHEAGPAPAEISEHLGFTITPLPDGGRLLEHQASGLHTVFDEQHRWISREYWPSDAPQTMDGLKAVVGRTWDDAEREVLSYRLEGSAHAMARFDVAPVAADTV
ncbi:MAG: hypothetical protein JO362_10785, partial [Streptomycetaceae bacterium]|nr:hypothetical protein [Streptomycetaceae bacterium]